MSAIAIRTGVGMLALAEVSRFGLFAFKNDGSELRPLMFAIAKRLVVGKPTRAPRVFFSRFKFDLFRAVIGNFGQIHLALSIEMSSCLASTRQTLR